MHRGNLSKNAAVIPCGITNITNPYMTCCVPGEYCMSDSICHFTNSTGGGYYCADCTDPTLRDPTCATRCGGQRLSDTVYNSTTGFWACCSYDSDGKADCDDPTNEIFPGPAPSDLVKTQYLPEEGTPDYAVAANTSTDSTEGSSSSSDSSGSSVRIGTVVAAGVGACLGLFIIFLAAILFLQRRHRGRRGQDRRGLVQGPVVVSQGDSRDCNERGELYELPKSEPQLLELDGQGIRHWHG
ncbi:hypothetical protein BJX99DRAFT_262255 [Aspergillus californicus]